MLAEWIDIVNLKNKFASEKRMYEENHYCVFDMNASAGRAPSSRLAARYTATPPTRMEHGFPAIFAGPFSDNAQVNR